MSLWEYKVITSGKGGFATPALLEKFLNDLGREEWEIIHFQTPPENFLAFTGLVRRSTQRDWTLQDAAAAAAKAEADKLRAEFEAKFKAAASGGSGAPAEERAPSFLEEKTAPDDGFRKPVDTSHDDDPEAQEDDKTDEWDKLTAAEEDELPTFFDAIKPHLRRNQRGPGMSVGVDYLAKKWDQAEDDLKGALAECGFVVPADEDSKVEYLEYDGDLYWLNINRRGELWINTKEKPRPVFRSVKAQKVAIEEEPAKPAAPAVDKQDKPENGDRKPESTETPAGEASPAGGGNREQRSGGKNAELPQGPVLLNKIRPHMRRNRRGPGGSGSTTFLARALRTNEADLRTAFTTLGLTMPANAADKAVYTEVGNELWWLNLDSRGGLWINGREKKDGETAASATASDESSGDAPGAVTSGDLAPVQAPAPAPDGGGGGVTEASAAAAAMVESPIETSTAAPADASASVPATGTEASAATSPANPAVAALRPLLKESRGSLSGKLERLAEETGRTPDELVNTLVAAGMKLPEKPREKPVFVESAGEVLWLSKNAKGELWLNAKAAKLASSDDSADESGEPDAEGGDDKPRRGRGRKKEAGDAPVESTEGK